MLVQIITPEKTEWQGEADSLTLPAVGGQITILPQHTNLICAIEAGEMIIKQSGKEVSFFTTEGCVQIKDNQVTVMADLATEDANITSARVEEALLAAKKAKETQVDDVEFTSIEANLRRELSKEKIMEKYKKKVRSDHLNQ